MFLFIDVNNQFFKFCFGLGIRCRLLPTDNVSMLAVSGVGQTKLSRYGADFLDEIADYLAADHQPPAGKLAK